MGNSQVVSPVDILIWQSDVIQGLNINPLLWNSIICVYLLKSLRRYLWYITQEMLTLDAETWFGFWLGS